MYAYEFIQQVQPVLRPKFVSSAAKLEKHPGYFYFSSGYRVLLSKCLSVSSMAKPSCMLAFDLYALQICTQTIALFPGLPSFQLLQGLSKLFFISQHRKVHVGG